jgi:hypothetical protein
MSELRPAEAEPFSVVDLCKLRDALDRLLAYEELGWPTREHYITIQQLEYLRHEIAKRIPSP